MSNIQYEYGRPLSDEERLALHRAIEVLRRLDLEAESAGVNGKAWNRDAYDSGRMALQETLFIHGGSR